uniref:protein disulfide-isomerase n=1 Tax=Lactuca sativa TaxID=4236 RepID=A0A9R1W1P0_LACSA|nr:hypothetical protein LSAT_V11C300148840 [Lactuca sativa]
MAITIPIPPWIDFGMLRVTSVTPLMAHKHHKQMEKQLLIKNEKDVVISNLDVDNYKDLSEKMKIISVDVRMFFPKNNKDGEDYEDGRDIDSFVTFINEKCGTSRYAKGQLTSIVSLSKEFMTTGSDEKKALYAKIEEEVGKVTDMERHIYVKDVKSSLSKGCDYANNEIQRLEHILSKADEFTLKKNILSAFA